MTDLQLLTQIVVCHLHLSYAPVATGQAWVMQWSRSYDGVISDDRTVFADTIADCDRLACDWEREVDAKEGAGT